MVVDVLNNVLKKTNLDGYSILQESGAGGSQADLNTAEMFGLFMAQIVAKNGREFNSSKENIGMERNYTHQTCVYMYNYIDIYKYYYYELIVLLDYCQLSNLEIYNNRMHHSTHLLLALHFPLKMTSLDLIELN